MRELKFKMIFEKKDGETETEYYRVGSKPLVMGYKIIAEDLQFTGLKDKNEKDIFEGDILEATLHSSRRFGGKVIFDKGCFCLEIIAQLNHYIDFDIGQTPELNNFEELVVFGNIFLNPELLKK